jgi:hypothetical protein
MRAIRPSNRILLNLATLIMRFCFLHSKNTQVSHVAVDELRKETKNKREHKSGIKFTDFCVYDSCTGQVIREFVTVTVSWTKGCSLRSDWCTSLTLNDWLTKLKGDFLMRHHLHYGIWNGLMRDSTLNHFGLTLHSVTFLNLNKKHFQSNIQTK